MAKGSRAIKKYLILYNATEAVLWAAVLTRLFLAARVSGLAAAHDEVSTLLLAVQTSAVLEVVHVSLGLVPSPLVTTVTQVASRLLLVWGIDRTFPRVVAANAPVFASMVTAWSVTEVLRYAYYAIHLQAPAALPDALLWARYTLFYVLYPLGAGSECWLIYRSLGSAAQQVHPAYRVLLQGVLLLYVPGFYALYTYMIAQRKKMYKRQGKKVAKQ